MNLNTGLFQQQSLKLVMTKEFSQEISLLQYSTLELTKYLEELTIENPLIDLKLNTKNTRNKSKLNKENYTNPIDYIEKDDTTLYQHLLSQISYVNLPAEDKKIAEYIINLLDHNGYLYIETNEIAHHLAEEPASIEKVIHFIQTLDPVGVGARSLQECLLLQLKHLSSRHYLAEEIIEKHFILFAEKSWKEIAKQLDIKLSEIQAVYDFIQSLNPRPGAIFHNQEPAYIIPDIEVQVEDGDVFVSFHDDYLPKITVNKDYYKHLKQESDPTTKTFLQEKFDQCQWIIRGIEQRKQTLQKVMNEIVNKQLDYFVKGPSFLKPLTMNEVADAIDVHESTISRAVKDKYVQTPFGTVELKHFFSRNIQTVTDADTSSTEVKRLLKKLIDDENKLKPLSDQDLVGILKENNGILVSRRTIAKYRDQLNIPSSTKRKRYDE